MFIKRNTKKVGDKTYHSALLARTYRDEGKVRTEILLNLSSWPESKIKALESCLKGKTGVSLDELEHKTGKSIGALHCFNQLALETGVVDALGNSKHSKLAILLVLARILTQGSRLKVVSWSETQAVSSVLGLKGFSLDSLYETLDWLSENQNDIEDKLFKSRKASNLFLYDVTSSYLEGEHNELAEYGYNRDKKENKKQIVIGLLTDDEGVPVSVQVFDGNTSDCKTVSSQIQKIKERFGCKNVTFVGDKGMIKSAGIEALHEEEFHYITTITKAQIEKLLERGIIQLSLFDEALVEVEEEEARYILRRNPIRAAEMRKTRESKEDRLVEFIEKENAKKKAKLENKLERVNEKIKNLQIHGWTEIKFEKDEIKAEFNEQKREEASRLDGCYVIKTDLEKDVAKETVHKRYKDLALVESAFKTLKTGYLEIRPLYVVKESRTKGHIFASMLAYRLIQEFKNRTAKLDYTLEEMIDVLDKVQTIKIELPTGEKMEKIPTPTEKVEKILQELKIKLPKKL